MAKAYCDALFASLLWALSLLRVMDSLSAFAHFGSRIQRPGYFKDTKNEEQCQY
jgi:hypothetical protein